MSLMVGCKYEQETYRQHHMLYQKCLPSWRMWKKPAKQLHNEAEWARKHPIRIQQIQDIDDLLCF